MNVSFFVPFNDDKESEDSIEIAHVTSDPESSDSENSILSQCSILSETFLASNEIDKSYINADLISINCPTSESLFQSGAGKIESTPEHLQFTQNLPTSYPVDYPKYPTSKTMTSLAKCRDFSGYPQDNPRTFLSEFESYALLHELSEHDPRRIAAFHLHLKGPALVWFNSLSDAARKSWTHISILFKEKYVNFNWQSATVIMESEIFQNMVLSPGQSLEDYFSKLSEKSQMLEKPEHELVAKFISGLPDKMAFFVRAGHPKDATIATSFGKDGRSLWLSSACRFNKCCKKREKR